MQRRWFLLALATGPTAGLALDEPEFELLRRLGEVELRHYAPYVVAEVSVPGPQDKAGSRAFPILAGYVFGNNLDGRMLAMAAPVTQLPQSRPLATAVSTRQSAMDEVHVVQFVLPKGMTVASAPVPTDARVRLRQLPARRLAVIRFSGAWTAANYDEHLSRLLATLHEANLTWAGEPAYSRYNPPLTPWFLRRNEIWLELR